MVSIRISNHYEHITDVTLVNDDEQDVVLKIKAKHKDVRFIFIFKSL